MTDLGDIMATQTFLETCIGIEGLCAELYHFYSKTYEDIPEASRIWEKTALEEENHQRQFALAYRLMNETRFEIMKDSLQRAFFIQYKLQKLMKRVRSSPPDLLAAVITAVDIEEKLEDLHAHTAIVFEDKSMQNLFCSLSKADRDHVADLRLYRTTLTLSPRNPEGGKRRVVSS